MGKRCSAVFDIHRFLLAIGCCLLGVGAEAQQNDMLRFPGICDASAAIALDDNRIIIGDDEQPFLSTYRLDNQQLEGTLAVPFGEGRMKHGKKQPPELDLEAATVFKDRIVWISSHGRDGDGRVDRDRFQLFASHRLTPDTGLANVEFKVSFHGLLDAVLAQTNEKYRPLRDAVGDLNKKDPALAPKEGGFNIEGMTVDRDGSTLLIGLRNPSLADQRAALFEIANAGDLLDGNSNSATLGGIIPLDLGRGRGIRDIVWSPAHEAYLIAAGPRKDGVDIADFALFKWTGRLGETDNGKPEEVVALASLFAAHPDFHLEAVVPLKERRNGRLVNTKSVLLISDDGKLERGKCSDLAAAERSFRGVIRTIN
jgi:Protein of unknown function (DUF3616)